MIAQTKVNIVVSFIATLGENASVMPKAETLLKYSLRVIACTLPGADIGLSGARALPLLISWHCTSSL